MGENSDCLNRDVLALLCTELFQIFLRDVSPHVETAPAPPLPPGLRRSSLAAADVAITKRAIAAATSVARAFSCAGTCQAENAGAKIVVETEHFIKEMLLGVT